MRRNMVSMLGAAAFVGAMAVAVGPATAEDPVLRGIPSQKQLLNALDPTQGGGSEDAGPGVTTRAARPTHAPEAPSPATSAAVKAPSSAGVAAPPSASASLLVLFKYNSADLTPQARRQLDAVASALKSPKLDRYRFELQGHTDATGGEEYNLALSEQRAKAVFDYLVQQHGIDPQRLTAVGVGERDLLDPNNPTAEVNRRVKIVNLGS